MNTKIFAIFGVMALALGIWFFYKEDVKVEPAVPTAPNVSYEATEIKAVQTNPETGETEYTLTADSLVKNSAGVEEMVKVVMDWTPPKGETYQIEAARATFNQETGELLLKDGFTLVRKGNEQKPDMVITGQTLTGNTKARTVQSGEPITVKQGADTFKAQGFHADIQAGEYEFSRIEVEFLPPTRVDKPLF